MFGNKSLKDVHLIPLSNDTVSRGINHMAGDVESQLLERVKKALIMRYKWTRLLMLQMMRS
jgi:hypothetical protein